MDDDAGARLRGGVLIGAAVLALLAGGWWWQANAPASGPAPVAGAAGGAGSAPGARRAPERPESVARVVVDAETGEVLRADGLPGVSIDPRTGMVTDVGGAPGELFYRPDPEGGLPRFALTTWRVAETLVPGSPVVRQASDDGGRYLLQYRCVRPGTLRVRVTGAQIDAPSRVDCDGTVTTARVAPTSGPIRVSLSAVGNGPIVAEAQLVALP
ncbi:hypothetical protein [Micromonospora costi]|uniref:Uncharacterized protein n=1 Tax=Micromonospora costi TaxID=1530042 RepID=A0A3B0A551_9ACTN|nr:hypothetical protein [Micromonospora costi]RKN54457.1 hypothetical protein D7193_21045 [Micromonospora costi]